MLVNLRGLQLLGCARMDISSPAALSKMTATSATHQLPPVNDDPWDRLEAGEGLTKS